MTLTNLDLLLGEFAYRTEQYKKIHSALHQEYNKGRHTDSQRKLITLLHTLMIGGHMTQKSSSVCITINMGEITL